MAPPLPATYNVDDGGELSISLSSSQMRRSRVNAPQNPALRTPDIVIQSDGQNPTARNMAAPPSSNASISTSSSSEKAKSEQGDGGEDSAAFAEGSAEVGAAAAAAYGVGRAEDMKAILETVGGDPGAESGKGKNVDRMDTRPG